jgi:5-methylcytosine-specific restriction endonuclease McrA
VIGPKPCKGPHEFDDDGDCRFCPATVNDAPADEPIRKAGRRGKELTRGQRRKPKMDVSGLAPQHDYVQMKRLVLQRPLGGMCERCGQRRATDAHHRKYTAKGGPDAPSNLAAVCRQCHDEIHLNPPAGRAGGWIVPAWADFRARALLLHDGSLVLLDDQYGYSFVGWPKGIE